MEGSVILKWTLKEVRLEDVCWSHLAGDRAPSLALMNMVVNYRVSREVSSFSGLCEPLLACQGTLLHDIIAILVTVVTIIRKYTGRICQFGS
jgi:hypothetical protein